MVCDKHRLSDSWPEKDFDGTCWRQVLAEAFNGGFPMDVRLEALLDRIEKR